jgi:hypothetical protein
MSVGATVVASCSIVPGRPSGASPSATCDRASAGSAIVAPQPFVTFSTDAATGITWETITF